MASLASTARAPESAEIFRHAMGLHQSGQIRDAVVLYERVLLKQRNHVDALHLLGVCQHGLGDYLAAEKNIRKALRLAPTLAPIHLNYGNTLRELKRLREAIHSYQRAAELDPRLALAHFNLGTAWEESGEIPAALAAYERAIGVGGPHPNALSGRANCLLALGRTSEAVQAYLSALSASPDMSNARANLALALDRLGRGDEAMEQVRLVLQKEPGHEGAKRLFLSWVQERGRPGERLLAIQDLRAQNPDDVNLMVLHARCLTALYRLGDAAELIERILVARPSWHEMTAELACHRSSLGDADTALALLKGIPESASGHFEVLYAKGLAHQLRGEFPAARDFYERTIRVQPSFQAAEFQKALIDLLEGDYERGLPAYEKRWNDAQGWMPERRFSGRFGGEPRPWRGQGDLRGQSLLVHSEQGLGDTVHFCRYLPQLAARGARVVLQVPEPVRSLIQRNMPSIEVFAFGKPLPEADLVCPLASLPLAMGTTLSTIPSSVPYLRADAERVRLWSRRLGPARGRRIGFAWSGSTSHANDTQRSMALDRMRPILRVPGLEFVALQTGLRAGDRAVLSGEPSLCFLGEAIGDLEDTAALAALCDLVVSVDTSTVHVAGALGRPVWILLPYVPDWRWLLERSDSPWYPSARLFRQGERGNWNEVIDRVAAALEGFAAGEGAP